MSHPSITTHSTGWGAGSKRVGGLAASNRSTSAIAGDVVGGSAVKSVPSGSAESIEVSLFLAARAVSAEASPVLEAMVWGRSPSLGGCSIPSAVVKPLESNPEFVDGALRAAQVAGPAIPSTARPRSRCKVLMAAWVRRP